VDPLNSDVQIWGCNGLPNQQWDVDDYYIKDAQHGYCLALPDGDTTNGKRVQLQDSCTGHTWSHDAQGWTFADGDWHIRYKADPSKCLDAGGDMQAGIELMIWDCNDLPQQIWGYDADAKTIYLADSRRLQHSAGAAQTNLTLPAEEDLGSPNLTAQAEENLTAQAEDNLTAQAEEYLSGNSGKALRGSLRSSSAQCKQLSGTYCAGGGQACNCAYCDDFSKNDECANTCRVMNGYFSSPFQGAPVGASLLGESGQRSGRNRLLVDEGERLWRTGGRLQALRRFRHEVQEGQPAAYRGYVPGEQRRQLQGLVRAQREKWQFHLLCSVAAASLFSWERVC